MLVLLRRICHEFDIPFNATSDTHKDLHIKTGKFLFTQLLAGPLLPKPFVVVNFACLRRPRSAPLHKTRDSWVVPAGQLARPGTVGWFPPGSPQDPGQLGGLDPPKPLLETGPCAVMLDPILDFENHQDLQDNRVCNARSA